ncbi:MAG: Vanadium haloperoxidase [uncultured Gemmatimonadetes bacterium]|uniref:Vanadium haloperoxidase n=1 Tax=uncultured Gemmatimonadota bacterium TaxID=203437 RepID=A0A6J4LXF7_9BACT|nr:MAG: Vanadium haloperoxidase [uncultured Gemmatimonadota bacterium]
MAKAHETRDTFNEPGTNTAVWAAYGSVQEAGGRLEVYADPWAAWSYSGYYSTTLYDLTGSSASIEVQQLLQAPGDSWTYLELKDRWDHDNRVYIAAGDGYLFAAQVVGGAHTHLAIIPYDAWQHRWWRIRESGGTLYFEASPDGCGWSTVVSAPNPILLTQVMVGFGAGTDTQQNGDSPPAILDNYNVPPMRVAIPDRTAQAFDIRVKAAQIARDRGQPQHVNNGEECDYPFVANYSKGLRHDSLGDVDPASYQSLLHALNTRNPADFEAIILGPGGKKLTNPQAGLAFTLEGPDTHAVTMPPAPRIDSPQGSGEMGELYWMALARDVHFNDYPAAGITQAAIASLNGEFTDFRGPRENGQVTPQTLFRGIFPGETVGPYLSQFLLKGTSDPRLPSGQGRCASEGLIVYGDLKIDQRQVTVVPGVDYLIDFPWWLEVQDGADKRGMDAIDTSGRRFVRNLRDLGERVHIDFVVDHFYNACLILLNEVPGDQLCGNGRVTADREFAYDPGNPYNGYQVQAPFATLGQPDALTRVTELLSRSLQAVWFQKWFVHRRLRPEELGGRIDNMLNGRRGYPIDRQILDSLKGGGLAPYFGDGGEIFPYSFLLPQAYPEGAPTHPAYGAGHATGSGACATILKAFFDEDQAIESPVVPNADGTALDPYTGWDAGSMTVGGELNKLAGNIALGRNAAGVHWRSDYDQSLLLGEQIALGVLQEQSLLLNEPEFFLLTKFDGTRVRIENGQIF